MSELLNNAVRRKELLKHMILQIHGGHAPDAVRAQLVRLLGQVPYNDVVEVEQELISEGLSIEEVLRLCDLHTAALSGAIDTSGAPEVPPGHPAHTFQQENRALGWEIEAIERLYEAVAAMDDEADASEQADQLRTHFNALMDVEKHYLRKENLLFPFLEKHGITGPPKVMWGKHDEARALLSGATDALSAARRATAGELAAVVDLVLKPASSALAGMIDKEEQILLPMCLDTLGVEEWVEVYRQTPEIGYCLYDPTEKWEPEGVAPAPEARREDTGRVQLPSGSFTVPELTTLLNTIPFDLTFVDADDTVRFFTQGRERIFTRTRAILGRKVQFCHPHASVDVVERILAAFKAGEQDQATFWIELKGKRFVSIEYFAMRGEGGEYQGCLEVSQDLTEKRALSGERRLLTWDDASEEAGHE